MRSEPCYEVAEDLDDLVHLLDDGELQAAVVVVTAGAEVGARQSHE